MRAIFRTLAFCLLCLPLLATAEETIKDFDVTLQVQADGKLLVTERIRVQAEGRQIKRGIYRDVPESYAEQFGLAHRAPVTLISVTRDGQREPVRTERTGSWRRFYIGSADYQLPSGEYTYELKYQVEQALFFRDGYDELYWNVTGNEWSFPIESVSAEVLLPDGVVINNVSAYTGSSGAKGDAYEVLAHEDKRVLIRATQPLSTYQGLTVALDWPPGVITRPSATQVLTYSLKDNLGVVLGGLVLIGLGIFYHRTWQRIGRDPAKGLVVPLFQPPQSISPVMAGYLWFRGFRKTFTAPTALSVWLTEMAIGKQLNISETEKGRGLTLTLSDAPPSDLSDVAQKMRNSLFAAAEPGTQLKIGHQYEPRLEVALEQLKSYLQLNLAKCYSLNTGGWVIGLIWGLLGSFLTIVLSSSAMDVKQACLGLLIAGMFSVAAGILAKVLHDTPSCLGYVILGFFTVLAWIAVGQGLYMIFEAATLPIATVLCGFLLLVIVYKFLLPALSQEGRAILDQLEGYRDYLRLGESELLELAGNAPAMSIALYERHLPYAMALGVEDKWTERFSNALSKGLIGPSQTTYQPSWYHGRTPLKSPAVLSGALTNGLVNTVALSSIPPGRSGGGGSRGGGSSGGGRGGGGGGGW